MSATRIFIKPLISPGSGGVGASSYTAALHRLPCSEFRRQLRLYAYVERLFATGFCAGEAFGHGEAVCHGEVWQRAGCASAGEVHGGTGAGSHPEVSRGLFAISCPFDSSGSFDTSG